MAVESTSGTQSRDFQGLRDAIDDDLSWSERQENLQLVVKEEMSVRPGLHEVTFEED
jgi:hypothetical protein